MNKKKKITDRIDDFTIASCGTGGGGSNSNIVNYETILADFGSASKYDAFNRLRISDPFTIFDSQNRYNRNTLFNETCVGTGTTVTYRVNESALDMIVGIGASAEIIRESTKVFPYQPGKSLLIMNSFAFASTKANLRQRIGYFGAQNGIYFEQLGDEKFFVLRSYVSGSIQETRIHQSQWNGYKFDGSEFYIRNLDPSKANIFWCDIEWLGVGDVRVGFVVDGKPIVGHIFHNDNLNTTTYMTTAVLPLRQEIANVAGTSSTSTMKAICATVISEGGYQAKTNMNFQSSNINSSIDLGSAGTRRPIISIRLNSNELDAVVLPVQADIACTNNDIIQYELILNGTIGSSVTWTRHNSSSAVDYAIGGTSISGGTLMNGGFTVQKTAGTIGGIDNFSSQLGRLLNGTSDIITLVCSSNGNNSDVVGALGWYELT
jgi:hypothetical protein